MPEVGYCRDCKKWQRQRLWKNRKFKGVCMMSACITSHPIARGMVSRPHIVDMLDGDLKPDSDWNPIQTPPNFGCILWKAKPSA